MDELRGRVTAMSRRRFAMAGVKMTYTRARATRLGLVATLLACAAVAGEPSGTSAAPVATMTQDQLVEHLTKHPQHLFVLDVRTPEEYAAGHVPGAVNVPHDQLASRLAEVPKDKDVVVYCRTGRRSALAADVLAANGYKRVSQLEGDMQAWVARGRTVEKR
jgi:phage shock protein E